jgi:hypothetical protein
VQFSQLLQFKPTNAQNITKITLHIAELPEIPTVLLYAENDNVQQQVYTLVSSPMIGRRGPKHVGVGVVAVFFITVDSFFTALSINVVST